MGQRLTLNIVRNDERIFNIYLERGADTKTKINAICKILSVCNKDDDLETLLKKATEVLPGCGLIKPIKEEDVKIVDSFIAKGIPEGTRLNGFSECFSIGDGVLCVC